VIEMKETAGTTALEESTTLDEANTASRIPEVQEFFNLLQNSIHSINASHRDPNRYDEHLRPAYQALVNFFERFESLTLTVEPLAFTFLESVVYHAEESEHNIAQRLYRDGVRTLTLHRGIPIEELLDLVLILSANVRSPEYAYNDTVSMLWKREFTHLEYAAIETAAVGSESEEQARLAIRAIVNFLSSQLTVDQTNHIQPARGSTEEYESEPYDLSRADGPPMRGRPANPEEKSAVLRQLGEEDENRIRPKLIAIVFQILEGALDQDLGQAIEEIFIQLLDSFLMYEDFRSINKILDKFEYASRRRLPPENLALINRIRALFLKKMSAPERIEQIARIMDSSAELTQPEEILRYLGALDEVALLPMIEALERTDNPQARPLWRDALIIVGKKRAELFMRRLSSNNPAFVQDLLTILGTLDPNSRLKAMTDLLDHSAIEIRIEALSTLAADGTPASQRYILKALNDANELFRMTAARLLTNFEPSTAAATLLTLIKHSEFSKKSPQEQTALYAALAMTNAAEALEYFRQLLHSSQFLARKKLIETKRLMVDGLAQSGSIVIFKFLKGELEAGIAEAEVRAAAEQACARLRETLLGGEH
jgi:HEAT repeat protein